MDKSAPLPTTSSTAKSTAPKPSGGQSQQASTNNSKTQSSKQAPPTAASKQAQPAAKPSQASADVVKKTPSQASNQSAPTSKALLQSQAPTTQSEVITDATASPPLVQNTDGASIASTAQTSAVPASEPPSTSSDAIEEEDDEADGEEDDHIDMLYDTDQEDDINGAVETTQQNNGSTQAKLIAVVGLTGTGKHDVVRRLCKKHGYLEVTSKTAAPSSSSPTMLYVQSVKGESMPPFTDAFWNNFASIILVAGRKGKVPVGSVPQHHRCVRLDNFGDSDELKGQVDRFVRLGFVPGDRSLWESTHEHAWRKKMVSKGGLPIHKHGNEEGYAEWAATIANYAASVTTVVSNDNDGDDPVSHLGTPSVSYASPSVSMQGQQSVVSKVKKPSLVKRAANAVKAAIKKSV